MNFPGDPVDGEKRNSTGRSRYDNMTAVIDSQELIKAPKSNKNIACGNVTYSSADGNAHDQGDIPLSVQAVDAAKFQSFTYGTRSMISASLEAKPCIGPCQKTTLGKYRCSNCKAWYCSHRCQAVDWPKHKPICDPPPPLEHPDGTLIRPLGEPLRRPVIQVKKS